MWIKKLQIAIIEKNPDEIGALMNETLEFKDKKDIETAMYLLKEANELMHTLKDETAFTLRQLKKNINFLKSTQTQTHNRLDVRS